MRSMIEEGLAAVRVPEWWKGQGCCLAKGLQGAQYSGLGCRRVLWIWQLKWHRGWNRPQW